MDTSGSRPRTGCRGRCDGDDDHGCRGGGHQKLQLPLPDLLYGDLQPFAEKTCFGIAFLTLTVGFGVVATLLLFAWVADLHVLRAPAFVLAVVLASGVSLSSHQATEPNSTKLSELADWLHLVSASVSVGGVAALAFLVWPSAPALRARAFLGFARLAVGLVAVMVLAGVCLALVRLPTFSDLWESDYGRVLVVKLANREPCALVGGAPPLRGPAAPRSGRAAAGATEPRRRDLRRAHGVARGGSPHERNSASGRVGLDRRPVFPVERS